MNDAMIIIMVFLGIILIPMVIVFLVLGVSKHNRNRKLQCYQGKVNGIVSKIVSKGLDAPYVIYVLYTVQGQSYEIHETVKLKSDPIKIGEIPIGQKKSFALGPIKSGDTLVVLYDEEHPEKGIIRDNNGLITG